MRILFGLLAATSAVALAIPAFAAPTITSASVTGPSGTVWDTVHNSYYTLFIQNPLTGAYANPTDNFTTLPLSDPSGGVYDYDLKGDGFPTNTPKVPRGQVQTAPNSDSSYTLTLNLSEGAVSHVLTGIYTPGTGAFVSNSGNAVFSSGSYFLSDFTWSRTVNNLVGQFSTNRTIPNNSPGSGFDYQGAFSVAAIPEPATWGLMILGFGAVGGALRARRKAQLALA